MKRLKDENANRVFSSSKSSVTSRIFSLCVILYLLYPPSQLPIFKIHYSSESLDQVLYVLTQRLYIVPKELNFV